MEQSRWEVVILRPTSKFLSLIAAHYPDVVLPPLSKLQTNNTAYTLQKPHDEEALLAAMEQCYRQMYHHEIKRWFGESLNKNIEISLFDFLCGFKFELHSQVVLLESSMHKGRQLFCIKPKSVPVKWIESPVDNQHHEDNTLERLSLSRLVEDTTVVIKNFKTPSEVRSFTKQNYRPLCEIERLRYCGGDEKWADLENFAAFNRYFSIETHTQLVHL